MKRIFAATLLCACFATAAQADDWPAWRGPTGLGFCTETNVPLTWSETENVKWKIPLEFQGNSTPVVFGQKIFMTQADKGGHQRSLLCFDRTAGEQLWRVDIEYPGDERNWNANWYGNASPMVDSERVVVSLGSAGMFCYDHAGKLLWKRTDLGVWEHAFGNASSPVIYKDLVILWCGPGVAEDKEAKRRTNILLAVNKATGETVWQAEEKNGSWGTPVISLIDGRDQLLLSTVPYLKSFDPLTGKELWFCEGLNKYVYTSPLVADGIGVAMSGYTGAALAVKLGGTGDITGDRLWLHEKNTQRVGSGMIIDGHVYMIEENGVPHAYNLETGEEVWQVKTRPSGGTTWGSMVHANGRLYVLMRNGSTQIFAAKPEYELIGANSLGKGVSTNSSLAISNGDIFIRTFGHLWCIGEK